MMLIANEVYICTSCRHPLSEHHSAKIWLWKGTSRRLRRTLSLDNLIKYYYCNDCYKKLKLQKPICLDDYSVYNEDDFECI